MKWFTDTLESLDWNAHYDKSHMVRFLSVLAMIGMLVVAAGVILGSCIAVGYVTYAYLGGHAQWHALVSVIAGVATLALIGIWFSTYK